MPIEVVVFDVNQTLSDLSPLVSRFQEVGAPDHLLHTWFASVLRDGFGLAAAGAQVPFSEIASGALLRCWPRPGSRTPLARPSTCWRV